MAAHPAGVRADDRPLDGLRDPAAGPQPTQFAPPAPPKLTSARYTRDFNEVKALGSATSTVRTPAQTSTALFYSGLANPQFQAMLRDQVTVRDLDFVTRRLQLTVTSTAVPDVRNYDTGRALRQDVVDGRMWLGIHFRFADTAARDMGLRLTDWTLDHSFQPLHTNN